MITFSKETLREALSGLRLLKPNKQRLPALRCLNIKGFGQTVQFEATNLNEHLLFEGPKSSPQLHPEETVLVPWDELNSIVKAADAGSDVVIQIKPNPMLHYTSKGARFSLPFTTLANDEWPVTPSPQGQPPVGIPSDALSSMVEAFGCASTDTNRQVLNSVYWDKHTIVACDGRQLFVRNSLNLPLPTEGILFPASKVPAMISKDAADSLLFWTWKQDSQSLARIALGSWMWTVRLIEGQYPNWRQVIPKMENYGYHLHIAEEDAERLKTVLPQLPGYKDAHSPICMILGEREVFLSSPSHLPQVRVPLEKSQILKAPANGIKDVQFDSNYLLGAIHRGFRELHVCDDVTPIIMKDEHRINLWVPNRPRIGPGQDIRPVPSSSAAQAKHPKAMEASHVPESTQDVSKIQTTEQPVQTTNNNTMVAIQQNTTVSPVTARMVNMPDTSISGVDAAQQSIQRVRDLLRELNGTLGILQTSIRESSRQYKALERDHESLKKNIRALRTVEV